MTALPPTSVEPAHPLLVTGDSALTAAVLRLAAGAGVPVDVALAPDPALGAWGTAPAVLVGVDQADRVAALGPPPREDVHLVSVGEAADAAFRLALGVGARSVLELPAAEGWLAGLLADIAEGSRSPAVTIGVVGGAGGVGASVLAAALAMTAAQHDDSALLVDLDPLGPGLGRLVGLDAPVGATWNDLDDSRGRLGGRALRESVPRIGRLGVLGWPRGTPAAVHPLSPQVVREAIAAGKRGHGWVVLDVPRQSDSVTTGVLARCDQALLVVRAGLGGLAAGARMADRLRTEAADAGVVVRTRRGCPPAEDVARAVGLPLVAVLRDERRLDEQLDLGLGPVHSRRSPLSVACRGLVDRWAPGR